MFNRYHLYNQPLPDVRAPESEFVRLVYYLELVTEGMDWDCFNAAVALNWPSEADQPMHKATPQLWCHQLSAFINKGQIAARSFLVDQHINWHAPRLLQLPREYEKIFTVGLFRWFIIMAQNRFICCFKARMSFEEKKRL